MITPCERLSSPSGSGIRQGSGGPPPRTGGGGGVRVEEHGAAAVLEPDVELVLMVGAVRAAALAAGDDVLGSAHARRHIDAHAEGGPALGGGAAGQEGGGGVVG